MPKSSGREAFADNVLRRAWRRQLGVCARCAKLLSRVKWNAYHANGDSSDVRLRNCVLVCRTPCHLIAHAGRWNGKYVLRHEAYPYRNMESTEMGRAFLKELAAIDRARRR